MKHYSINKLYIFIAFITLSLSAIAQPANHGAWMRLTTDQLLDMGKRDIDNGFSKDTALMCYTIVANRYEQSMTIEQKRQCVDANMQLWAIYYYNFYDYPKCFECLARALECANDAGIKDANIHIGFGCMYQTISEECGNYDLGTKALEHYRKALQVGIDTRDYMHTDMACTDLISMSHARQGLETIGKEWDKYNHITDNKAQSMLRRYNLMLYQAFSLIEHNKHDDAIAIFDKQLALIDTTQFTRLVYFTCVEKAKAQALKGNYISAISTLSRPEHIALKLNMKDCQLEVFGLLAKYHQAAGNNASRELYRDKYTALKDTLNNYHQLASVSEMEFQGELKSMEKEMTEVKHHREIMSIVTLVSLVFLAVVLALLFFVFKKNRQLKRSNRSLYLKNVQMLQAEEEERRMRRQLNSATASPETGATSKYKNSHLSDDDKSALYSRIINIMESNDEIYSPEFSLERLAMLCDSKYKYVSQVIHENRDLNFNNFLNSYRIKEACKRMGDVENYGNFTIEAISASVGFKSRSTFVTSFKKVTGLTPSQYQRLALEEAKK